MSFSLVTGDSDAVDVAPGRQVRPGGAEAIGEQRRRDGRHHTEREPASALLARPGDELRCVAEELVDHEITTAETLDSHHAAGLRGRSEK